MPARYSVYGHSYLDHTMLRIMHGQACIQCVHWEVNQILGAHTVYHALSLKLCLALDSTKFCGCMCVCAIKCRFRLCTSDWCGRGKDRLHKLLKYACCLPLHWRGVQVAFFQLSFSILKTNGTSWQLISRAILRRHLEESGSLDLVPNSQPVGTRLRKQRLKSQRALSR